MPTYSRGRGCTDGGNRTKITLHPDFPSTFYRFSWGCGAGPGWEALEQNPLSHQNPGTFRLKKSHNFCFWNFVDLCWYTAATLARGVGCIPHLITQHHFLGWLAQAKNRAQGHVAVSHSQFCMLSPWILPQTSKNPFFLPQYAKSFFSSKVVSGHHPLFHQIFNSSMYLISPTSLSYCLSMFPSYLIHAHFPALRRHVPQVLLGTVFQALDLRTIGINRCPTLAILNFE